MSPARSKRQTTVAHKRDRTEILRAVGVSAAIVIVTAILIWLLRPGPAGVPATGGLMNRQPRASWLIGLGLGIGAIATWWILTRSRRRTRERAKVILPIALGVVAVACVVAGFLWPGGLLRHDVAPTPQPTTPTTTPAATSPTTGTPTSAGQTTLAPTTVAPATTAPSASTATTATP